MDSVHDNYTTTFVSIKYNENIIKKYEQLKSVKQGYGLRNLYPKDIFINLYGFVNFEYAGSKITITPPKKRYNSKKVTDAQIHTAIMLLKINNLKPDEIYQLITSNEITHDDQLLR